MITLKNDIEIPLFGVGTSYQRTTTERSAAFQQTLDALRIGYRLIDTAQHYQTEQFVGQAIEKFIEESNDKVTREEIFISTKISPANYDKVKTSFKKSLKKLGHIDLIMLHYVSDLCSAPSHPPRKSFFFLKKT